MLTRSSRLYSPRKESIYSEDSADESGFIMRGSARTNSMICNGDESISDFSPGKAPKSLRGITSIAEAGTPVLASSSSQDNGGQETHHPGAFMMHTRRHTAPDARPSFGNAMSNSGSMVSQFPLGVMSLPSPLSTSLVCIN